jgi:acetyl esterase/lipase
MTSVSSELFSHWFYLVAPLLLSGCIGLGTAIANAPTHLGGLHRQADIAYGREPQQKLDIYTSGSQIGETRPVIIFLYGGRWSSGNKEEYRFVAARLAKADYLVVIPDYIKYPQAKFPAFMDDGARSIAWVHQHIADYGGNPARLYLMGHSSGAHMGALLISDAHYLQKYGTSPKIISAFAGLAGPYDFTPESPDLKDMFGPPERYPQMQVPTFITGQEPPMLLLRGSEDDTVASYNTTRLADAIRAHNGIATTKTYPGIGHIGIIASFSWIDNAATPVAEDCIAFFNGYQSSD